MNTTFEQLLHRVPAETQELFLHKLRHCAVEEAYDVLFCAGFGKWFSMPEVIAYRTALLERPESSPVPTDSPKEPAGAANQPQPPPTGIQNPASNIQHRAVDTESPESSSSPSQPSQDLEMPDLAVP